MKAVHFGAGNIGRGFIGLQLVKSGYDVCFIDVNAEVVEALQSRRAYTVGYAAEEAAAEEVSNVTALNSQTEAEQVMEAIATADVVTTAVGPTLLARIAPLLAEGIKRRTTMKNVYVIACENMIEGSSHLQQEVMQHLDTMPPGVFFPNAAVDRIVPLQHHEDPLYVEVEPFFEWVIETKDLPDGYPTFEGVTYVTDITPFIERKLFTVNTGHAIASYLGALFGKETIAESLQDVRVRRGVQTALYETGWLLLEKYGFDPKDHSAYIQKNIKRFENPRIHDEIVRVARSPIRKLGPRDRLVKPARELMDRGIEANGLALGIAAALTYSDPNDSESSELNTFIEQNGIRKTVATYLGLEADERLSQLIVSQYEQMHPMSDSIA
ncbi:mannitol-1-phosphate 5-dehydrogenase [Exiguobacterium sp. RIT594]|uniref:mannitol-1-phosphate 5-dehydrogenase n=1 Tax=Exiguobacterium sp. RIT594 TaxID=2282449 RepID=UPI000DF85476|nr:mannitol-1-phosphate 5-dehydrogenase [Exiguobacterium sp. RIT594]RDB33938.1 mannitol-1-phosphate 5-dehydrogenase [Exiguobacterium sp. RIT594]